MGLTKSFPALAGAMAAALGIALAAPAASAAVRSTEWPAAFAIAPSDSSQVTPAIASDGSGGAYVLWSDYRQVSGDEPPVNAQHVASAGQIANGWPASGLQLPWRSSEAGQIAIPDGAGGVFTATGGWDWYGAVLIEHLGPDGLTVPPWPADGVTIRLTSGPEPDGPTSTHPTRPDQIEGAGPGDIMPAIALDNAGGLLLSWTHVSRAAQCVHVTRITASGALAAGWPATGVIFRLTYDSQTASAVCADGSGGALVAWEDEPGTIMVDHALSNGTIDTRWPSGGLLLSDPAHASEAPGIVSDGQSGCFVAWQQGDASGVEHPVVEHLLVDGSCAPGWSSTGLSLSSSRSEAGAFRIYSWAVLAYSSVVADGSGGVLVAWSAIVDGAGRVYAQRVLGDGPIAEGWPAGGLAVGPDPSDERLPALAPDGAGGAFVAWQEGPGDGSSAAIVVQHVDGTGAAAPGWPRAGQALATGSGTRCHPVVVAGGTGAAVVAWEDRREGRTNIYAGSASAATTGIPHEATSHGFSLEGLRPNPSLSARLRAAFELPSGDPASLELVDIAGRRLVIIEVGALGAGAHVVTLDAPHPMPAGLYWLRLRQGGRALSVRGAVIR